MGISLADNKTVTNSNNTGEFPMQRTVQQQVIQISLCSIALLLNLTVLILIVRKRRRKRATPMILIFTQYFILGVVFCIAFLFFENMNHKTELEFQLYTSLCWFISHLVYNNLAFISLQRLLAVYKPLKCKYWITNKVTKRFIAGNYLVTFVHYTICTIMVIMYRGFDRIMSEITNAVFVTELFFSFCPYVLISVKLCERKKNIGDTIAARRTIALVKSSAFCCLLLIASLVSVVPVITYNFGFRELRLLKIALLLVWTEPIFSAAWYLCLMIDWPWCKHRSGASRTPCNSSSRRKLRETQSREADTTL